jgi:hypothetical protein
LCETFFCDAVNPANDSVVPESTKSSKSSKSRIGVDVWFDSNGGFGGASSVLNGKIGCLLISASNELKGGAETLGTDEGNTDTGEARRLGFSVFTRVGGALAGGSGFGTNGEDCVNDVTLSGTNPFLVGVDTRDGGSSNQLRPSNDV